MSRSSPAARGAAVSLFPFLAVLLCTMGALVVLLVAMAQVTRRQAAAEAAAVAEAAAPKLTADEQAAADADAEARREQLKESEAALAKHEKLRDEAGERLRESQLRLGQIESHMQRLLDEARSMRAAYQEMKAKEAKHYDDRAQAERNLAQLQSLIEETKNEIETVREEQASQQKSYAVVPYRGQNGTSRRPIYVECRADYVELQPEGVRLTPADFQPPIGPGNPLAAALRASREYHARQAPGAGFDPDTEPYPLIIVRPDGIDMYAKVREAIRSWDSDFGYELVNQETNLKFPAPNPALSTAQSSAVEDSRRRRALLSRAAPTAYGAGGGYAGYGGSRRQRGGGGGGLPYDGQAFDGQPYGGDTDSGDPDAGQSAEGIAGGGGEGFSAGESVGDRYAANQYAGEAGGESTNSSGGQASSGRSTDASANAAPSSQAAGAPAGQVASRPPPSMSAGASNAASGDQAPQNGMMSVEVPTPVANQQGADWAVDENPPTAIAIRRPVSVIVHSDRLVLASGTTRVKTIPINGRTSAAIPELVDHVRGQVRSWGIAGQGLYWRPVLKLAVAADGYRRAQDISRLLYRSGIEVSSDQTAKAPARGGPNATR